MATRTAGKRPFSFFLFIVLVISVVGLVVFGFTALQSRIDAGLARGAQKDARYDALLIAYQELARDCAAADDCTTDAPSPAEVADDNPVSQSAGPGSTGAPGRNGVDGTDGEDGDPGPAGPAGVAGSDGTDGEAGTDGADGEPGGSGSPGPPGPAGADGAAGQPGADGAPGAPGADGQPPFSWSYTDPAGVPYICSQTDPFDPSMPTYTCSS